MIDTLIQKLKRRSEAFERMLAALPQDATCAAGHPSQLDRDASFAAGKAVYRCELCEMELAAERERQRRIRWGMPVDVLHATFANFDTNRTMEDGSQTPQAVRDIVEGFFAGSHRNLLLCGACGVGKGHLVAAGLNKHGWEFRWITLHRLFFAVHGSYDGPGPESVIAYYVRPPLLVLDEVGMSELPRDGARVLYDVIDGRHKARRQTAILSNLHPRTLRDYLTPPIVDRLRTGGAIAAWAAWQSMRGNEEFF